jgi:paraquat-inducible protein B
MTARSKWGDGRNLVISANTSLMGALAGLRDVQRQVTETLRHIDPNTTDPMANKARRDARQIQMEMQQKAADIASAIRNNSLDVEA